MPRALAKAGCGAMPDWETSPGYRPPRRRRRRRRTGSARARHRDRAGAGSPHASARYLWRARSRAATSCVLPNSRTLPVRTASSVARSDYLFEVERPRMLSPTWRFRSSSPQRNEPEPVVANRLVGDDDEVGGPPTDVDDRDRYAEPLGFELHAAVGLRDDVVVPGCQRLWNDFVKRDGSRQRPSMGWTVCFRLLRLRSTSPCAGCRPSGRNCRPAIRRPRAPMSAEARLVQRMLNDRAIETRERVAVEMRRFAVDLADRKAVSSVSYSKTAARRHRAK